MKTYLIIAAAALALAGCTKAEPELRVVTVVKYVNPVAPSECEEPNPKAPYLRDGTAGAVAEEREALLRQNRRLKKLRAVCAASWSKQRGASK